MYPKIRIKNQFEDKQIAKTQGNQINPQGKTKKYPSRGMEQAYWHADT